jgi:hypothetical protein
VLRGVSSRWNYPLLLHLGSFSLFPYVVVPCVILSRGIVARFCEEILRSSLAMIEGRVIR